MKKAICIILAVFTCGILWAQPGVDIAEGPALLTSLGQSADIEMARVLLNRTGIPFEMNAVVTAGSLGSNFKTIIMVLGGSSKGLGAAGISIDEELRRAQALVTRARELNMKIIVLHIGGSARRGALSDDFIRFAVPRSDLTLIVSGGNEDGLFTTLANEANVPVRSADRMAGIGPLLTAAFK